MDVAPPAVKTDLTASVEYVPTLGIDFRIEDTQFIQDDFEIELRSFDTAKLTGGLTNSVHSLEGVNVKVDLAQEKIEFVFVNERTVYPQVVEDDWQHITSIEGKTDVNGK